MSEETLGQIAYGAFTAVRYAGSLTTAWTSPAIAHKAWEATGQAVAASVTITHDDCDHAAEVMRLRDLVAEILDDFWPGPRQEFISEGLRDAQTRVDGYRQRAGLEPM